MTGVCWMMSRRTSSCHSCCGAACCWSSMSRSCGGAAMSTAAAEAARSRHPRKHTPLRAGTIRPGHSARRSASSSAGLPPRTLMCRETTCRRSRCREGNRPHRGQDPRSEGLEATAKARVSRGAEADAGRIGVSPRQTSVAGSRTHGVCAQQAHWSVPAKLSALGTSERPVAAQSCHLEVCGMNMQPPLELWEPVSARQVL